MMRLSEIITKGAHTMYWKRKIIVGTGLAVSLAITAVNFTQGSQSKSPSLASVAYAGSLQLVNDQFVGPTFEKKTGYSYQGRGGGALGVAHLIAGREITPNVFESMGLEPLKILEPKFTTWGIAFASSPLVIAFNSKGRYARQLEAIAKGQKPLKDLFNLMQEPQFHLGRTNPQTDPQGQAFLFMMHLAQQQLHLAPGTIDRILGGVNNPHQIFSEEGILSLLQAGQLDATSAFESQAVQRHLPFIRLPSNINMGDASKAALYAKQSLRLTSGKIVRGAPLQIIVSTLQGMPDPAAGTAFVHFLLSKLGRDLYQREGYVLIKPEVIGDRARVPRAILTELSK